MTKPESSNDNTLNNNTLLEVRDLHVTFFLDGATAKAVEGVNMTMKRGQTLGLVGESGCGKSVTSLALMRLVPSPPGKIVHGDIIFDGRNILKLSDSEMRKIRGGEIGMIFQEPMTSFNPVFTIGDQIAEAVTLHEHVSRREAWVRAIEMLRRVNIPAPEQRAHDYPHQLSGGMRQRAMIAMALSCRPKLLIADEPTTALDVTIQAQILELFEEIKQNSDTSVLLVTHNLGVVAQTTDEVAVMYAGRIVEHAEKKQLFNSPQHPYTQGLLDSVPRITGSRERLNVIEGNVPDPAAKPPGCPFHPRCPKAMYKCRVEPPIVTETEPGHTVSCWAV